MNQPPNAVERPSAWWNRRAFSLAFGVGTQDQVHRSAETVTAVFAQFTDEVFVPAIAAAFRALAHRHHLMLPAPAGAPMHGRLDYPHCRS